MLAFSCNSAQYRFRILKIASLMLHSKAWRRSARSLPIPAEEQCSTAQVHVPLAVEKLGLEHAIHSGIFMRISVDFPLRLDHPVDAINEQDHHKSTRYGIQDQQSKSRNPLGNSNSLLTHPKDDLEEVHDMAVECRL